MAKKESFLTTEMIISLAMLALIIFVAPKYIPTETTPLAVVPPTETTEEPIFGGGSGGGSGGDTTPEYTITLDMNPNNICLGDQTTGTITSNMPGASCTIYYETSLIPGWFIYKGITLDANGEYEETQTLNTAGSIEFYVTCRYNEQNIDSNYETVTVEVCNGNGDGDGEYTCTDSDGGIDANTWGHCEDSYHQAGFQDTCETMPGSTATGVREYYCDENNICQSTLIQCSALAGLTCSEGRCTTI